VTVLSWRALIWFVGFLGISIGSTTVWAFSDSHVDTSGRASRVLVSSETLENMIALIDRWASSGVHWKAGARDFLDDSRRSLARKKDEDSTVIGLEFAYDKREQDCKLYYRSAKSQGIPQKEFVREGSSCLPMKQAVFSIFHCCPN
jgi:hypothetical protein